ncbi:MAG TPA: ABC transporter ATP-binding protein, partial [Streptosporangiaceae bacterium]|nr:ABC transporter ATP-binding protein [Streptosporangiaceae bacterium]
LLLGHVKPYRWTILGAGLLGFLGGLASLAQPMVAKLAVDTIGQRRSLTGPVALLAAVTIAGALLSVAGLYLLSRTAESVVLTARERLVSRLLRLQVSTLDRLKPGELLSRVTSDTTLLRSVSTYGLVHTVNATFLLVGSIVLMARLDPVLLLVTVAVLAVNAVAVLVVVPRIRRATERSQAAVGRMGAVLERALGGFRTIKAHGAEEEEIAAVSGAARQAWRRGVEVAGWTALMEASAGLAVQVSFLAVLGVGGARVASGALPVSSLVAFLLYLFLLTDPVTSLINGATQLQAGLAAVVRLQELEGLPVEPAATRRNTDLAWSPGPASVTFTDVWFKYRYPPDGPWAHRGLTFHLPPGGTTAIVGPSGSGKSTIFALLERYYEPSSGSIAIDGRDIRTWPLPELRAAIGYVEQDAPILAGTLRDNLRLASPDATDDDFHAVLTITRLQGLLDRLPRGLDTPIGHRGTTLSGGERQRIAIARAVLRRPRVLLLDEATSQLDAVNELAIRALIEAVAPTTTVVVIAHRLSTVTSADRILVMEAGRVRAIGRHAELASTDDLYRRLVTSQLLAAET